MPTPRGKDKDDEDHSWLLSALDKKFVEQEEKIQKLLNQLFEKVQGHQMARRQRSDVSGLSSLSRLEATTSFDAAFLQEPVYEVSLDAHSMPVAPISQLCQSTEETQKGMRNSRSRGNFRGTGVMKERWEPEPPLKAFVKGPLDGYMGLVVLVNLAFMITMTQWIGSKADASLGLPASSGWQLTDRFFAVAEYIFFSIYVMDVLVRVFVLRHEWYYDLREGIMYLNIFDAAVVCLNAFELLILPLLFLSGAGGQEQHANSIRVIKFMRIVRTLRIVKTVTIFRQLRLLVGTCIASIGALFWSMVLLMVLKVGFALIICQALQGFILDDQQNLDTRMEVNSLYGNFGKAFYTMFEVTHSGSWPRVVRPIVEFVDAWYAVPFLAYITLVVFAVIRIVTALFLKETLASAANDADMVMDDAAREAINAQKKLEELFKAADDDGDGNLSPEEFVEAMSLPSVQGFLTSMDVSIRDCRPLFDILDDGDGLITISEFSKGLMQLKGQARALDIVVLQHENRKLMKECREIQRGINAIPRRLKAEDLRKS